MRAGERGAGCDFGVWAEQSARESRCGVEGGVVVFGSGEVAADLKVLERLVERWGAHVEAFVDGGLDDLSERARAYDGGVGGQVRSVRRECFGEDFLAPVACVMAVLGGVFGVFEREADRIPLLCSETEVNRGEELVPGVLLVSDGRRGVLAPRSCELEHRDVVDFRDDSDVFVQRLGSGCDGDHVDGRCGRRLLVIVQ